MLRDSNFRAPSGALKFAKLDAINYVGPGSTLAQAHGFGFAAQDLQLKVPFKGAKFWAALLQRMRVKSLGVVAYPLLQ